MVGVPGRSKGCSTCRRRKKGCDKQVPICGQCQTAGLVCGGYTRERVWLTTTQDPTSGNTTYTKSSSGTISPRSYEMTSSSTPTSTQLTRTTATASPSSSSVTITPRRLNNLTPTSNILLHESLTQTAREEKFLGLYWSAYLPNGRAFSPAASRFSVGGWQSSMGSLYYDEITLRYAVLALSTSMIGSQNNDAQLQLKGLQTYTKAIHGLAEALGDPLRCNSDGLIGAVRLMGFYEVLFGPDGDKYELMARSSQVTGWHGHSDGEMALFSQRGPQGVTEGMGHQLFTDGRLNFAYGALVRRKRTPLSSLPWETIPWLSLPKTPKDSLIDILLKIAGLLEDLDTARAMSDPVMVVSLAESLMVNCNELELDLEVWKSGMGDKLYAYDYDVVGLPLPEPVKDEDFALLHLLNVYWVVCLFLYSTKQFAQAMVFSSPSASPANTTSSDSASPHARSSSSTATTPPPQAAHSAPFSIDLRVYPSKIARSIALFFRPAGGAYSANMALFPLGLALRFLIMIEPIDPISEERKLLIQSFNKPFMGTYVGRFLENLQKDAKDPQLQRQVGMEGRQARALRWWYEGNAKEEQTTVS